MTEWASVGNRLELCAANGEILESEIIRDGKCVHFDLSERKKTLKNMIRQTIGLKPIYPPKVIRRHYLSTEMGQARQQTVQYIREVEKQSIDSASKKAIKRDIVQVFRARYPRGRD